MFKKVFFFLLLVFSLSSFAHQWFYAPAFCDHNGAQGGCSVFNSNWYYSLYCQGTVGAVTFYGRTIGGGGMNLWIPPGRRGYSSPVYAPWGDPIVSVWHDLWCRY